MYMQNPQKVQQALEHAFSRIPRNFKPFAGIILGTGLGNLLDKLEQPLWIPYEELPNFPVSTVCSHAGQMGFGRIAGVDTVIQCGRFHLYEGYSPADVVMGVRLMAGLGCRVLMVASASGSLNPHFPAGRIMLMKDQINLTGESPLCGPNCDDWGPRFPDMSCLFDRELAELAQQKALEMGIPLERGVYVGVRGPQLETPAEPRAYRMLGGDAIGMSTVLETIAAKHLGMRILGFASLTNQNLPDCMAPTSLEEIIAAAETTGKDLSRLFTALLMEMKHSAQNS